MPEGAFTVREVGVVEEDGVLTLGLAENTDGTGRSILFMSPLPGDDDTTICLCNELQATAYDALEAVRLTRSTLELRLRAGVGHAFGLPDEVEMKLGLVDDQVTLLSQGITDVFDRCDPAPALSVEMDRD